MCYYSVHLNAFAQHKIQIRKNCMPSIYKKFMILQTAVICSNCSTIAKFAHLEWHESESTL